MATEWPSSTARRGLGAGGQDGGCVRMPLRVHLRRPSARSRTFERLHYSISFVFTNRRLYLHQVFELLSLLQSLLIFNLYLVLIGSRIYGFACLAELVSIIQTPSSVGN